MKSARVLPPGRLILAAPKLQEQSNYRSCDLRCKQFYLKNKTILAADAGNLTKRLQKSRLFFIKHFTLFKYPSKTSLRAMQGKNLVIATAKILNGLKRPRKGYEQFAPFTTSCPYLGSVGD
jgi:hypothetical protein